MHPQVQVIAHVAKERLLKMLLRGGDLAEVALQVSQPFLAALLAAAADGGLGKARVPLQVGEALPRELDVVRVLEQLVRLAGLVGDGEHALHVALRGVEVHTHVAKHLDAVVVVNELRALDAARGDLLQGGTERVQRALRAVQVVDGGARLRELSLHGAAEQRLLQLLLVRPRGAQRGQLVQVLGALEHRSHHVDRGLARLHVLAGAPCGAGGRVVHHRRGGAGDDPLPIRPRTGGGEEGGSPGRGCRSRDERSQRAPFWCCSPAPLQHGGGKG